MAETREREGEARPQGREPEAPARADGAVRADGSRRAGGDPAGEGDA